MTTIIGIDCACDSRKVGIAVADLGGERASVRYAATGLARDELVAMIAEVVARATTSLLALDAPLGWPIPLGDRLAAHRAGEPLAGLPDALFRRETDRFVHRTVGRLPLDVGADRIARTAKAALDLLAEVRTATDSPSNSLGRRSWGPAPGRSRSTPPPRSRSTGRGTADTSYPRRSVSGARSSRRSASCWTCRRTGRRCSQAPTPSTPSPAYWRPRTSYRATARRRPTGRRPSVRGGSGLRGRRNRPLTPPSHPSTARPGKPARRRRCR